MARVIFPRPRILRGRRVVGGTPTTEGSIVTSTAWDSDALTLAVLHYHGPGTLDTSNASFYAVREGAGNLLFGIAAQNPSGPQFATILDRNRDTSTDSLVSSGAAFAGVALLHKFAWTFAIDYGATILPDAGYCILGEAAVMQTSGWTVRQAGTGTILAISNPYTWGSRDNQSAASQTPWYAFALWDRVLTLADMTALARWRVPINPVTFNLLDTGRDLTGNGHNIIFNDIVESAPDFEYPMLRIPE